MESLLHIAQGPLFRFALLFMLLGLGRHLVLSVVGFVMAQHRAGGRRVPIGKTLVDTVIFSNPFRYLFRTRGLYTALTMSFHVGLLAVPLLLAGHIVLIEKATGLGWPHLPMIAADVLTVVTILAAVAVLIARVVNAGSRRISRPQDWLLPPLILLLFLSGFLMAHPALDVLPYPAMRLVHVLTGDLLLVLVPLTKLSHMILLPFSRLVAELGWRMVPGSGELVKQTLGKEGQPL